MLAHTEYLPENGFAEAPGLLRIEDTQWGFIVHEVSAGGHPLLAAAGVKFVALAALFAAGAQWLLPGSLFSGDVLLMKLGLTAALASSAIWLMLWFSHGGLPELHVGAARREIRVAVRTAQGECRVRSRIAMRDIEQCFVRPGEDASRTELCFRVSGHENPVRIAAGKAPDLAPVLERLSRDLRTPRERVAMKLAG